MFQKMKKSKGFTLIEMLVVIAIIAVLVSIIVPVVGNSTAKAKAAADAANLRSMASTLAIDYMNDGVLNEGPYTVPTAKSTDDGEFAAYVVNGNIECYFGGYSVSDFADAANTGTLGKASGVPEDGTDQTVTKLDVPTTASK